MPLLIYGVLDDHAAVKSILFAASDVELVEGLAVHEDLVVGPQHLDE